MDFPDFVEFTLHYDAPQKYINAWKNFIQTVHHNPDKFVLSVIQECQLDENKELVPLDRLEGGFGKSQSNSDRQVRLVEAPFESSHVR